MKLLKVNDELPESLYPLSTSQNLLASDTFLH